MIQLRLFIAIDLPKDIKKELDKIKGSFTHVKAVRPVKMENMHITLKFLGEIQDKYVDAIAEALKEVRFEPFTLSLNKLGVFPSEKYVRVIWVNAEPEEKLLFVKKQIDAALPGYKDDYHFKNHMTLARVAFPADAEKREIVEILKRKEVKEREFKVEHFALMRSHLSPKGANYEKIKEY